MKRNLDPRLFKDLIATLAADFKSKFLPNIALKGYFSGTKRGLGTFAGGART